MSHGDILLIEDSKLILHPLTRIIQKAGYRARCAMSRSEMRAILAEGTPILAAVLDYSLPDAMEGEALPDLLAQAIPTLVLTARNDNATRERILSYPVVDYVPKDMPGALEYVAMLVRRLDHNRKLAALIVDDSRTVRLHLKALLERYQFQVICAANADEAQQALLEHAHIRLALIDQDMPGMDGIALTSLIRRQFGRDRLAIIGISGSTDQATTARFIKAGADDFLKKPFNPEEFYCRITRNVEFLENIAALIKAANEDSLTGLPNRRAFFEAAARMNGPYSVAMLDVDHFKSINDHYGHATGDQTLQLLAQQIRAHFPQAMAARLGGEEFALLLPAGDGAALRAQLEALRTALAELHIAHDNPELRFTVSIGLSSQAADSIDNKLRQADSRLYQAKHGGRNRLVWRTEKAAGPDHRQPA